ncbi:hypothetical protein KEM09_19000 [Carboxylicivirga mesophila]|uniref:Uncharacterized protein n=1 Tax=Carboxylicivirga mesophila TaxID=1166478 RepID=A0ABS5KEU6_9BACT|nr:hypothetical protein [Carboxylicivirga mesophila]MBS2213506.1 hypothetical protein [Carboxylicivirga mesophila]
MEKDVYKRFVEDVKRTDLRMSNEDKFKQRLLQKINEPRNYSKRLIQVLRVAASIVLLLSLGTYIWMEVDTREQRWLVEQQINGNQLVQPSSGSCKQAVDKMMTLLASSESLPFSNKGVAFSKVHLKQIKSENAELFVMLERMLVYMEQFYPSDYAAFQSGETVQLTAWQLRKEYDVCNWITNN